MLVAMQPAECSRVIREEPHALVVHSLRRYCINDDFAVGINYEANLAGWPRNASLMYISFEKYCGVPVQPLVVTAQVSNGAIMTSVALFLDVDQTTINPASAPAPPTGITNNNYNNGGGYTNNNNNGGGYVNNNNNGGGGLPPANLLVDWHVCSNGMGSAVWPLVPIVSCCTLGR